jgi:hypothetical protein
MQPAQADYLDLQCFIAQLKHDLAIAQLRCHRPTGPIRSARLRYAAIKAAQDLYEAEEELTALGAYIDGNKTLFPEGRPILLEDGSALMAAWERPIQGQ